MSSISSVRQIYSNSDLSKKYMREMESYLKHLVHNPYSKKRKLAKSRRYKVSKSQGRIIQKRRKNHSKLRITKNNSVSKKELKPPNSSSKRSIVKMNKKPSFVIKTELNQLVTRPNESQGNIFRMRTTETPRIRELIKMQINQKKGTWFPSRKEINLPSLRSPKQFKPKPKSNTGRNNYKIQGELNLFRNSAVSVITKETAMCQSELSPFQTSLDLDQPNANNFPGKSESQLTQSISNFQNILNTPKIDQLLKLQSKQSLKNFRKKIIVTKKKKMKKKKKRPFQKHQTTYKIKWFGNPQDFLSASKFISIKDTLIGKGTYAKVVMGVNLVTKEQCAIKIISKMKNKKLSQRKTVQSEVNAMITLNHPNIVNFQIVVEDSNNIYLVMDYLGPENLRDFFKRPQKNNKQKIIRKIGKEILEGLAYIHFKGYSHRDLKVTNIMYHDNKAMIIDFGMASEKRDVKDYLICGTECYFAPEMIQRVGYFGDKVDVWCLGIILYFLISGEYPFGPKTDDNIRKRIVNDTPVFSRDQFDFVEESMISLMLRKDPGNRPSAKTLLEYDYWANQ